MLHDKRWYIVCLREGRIGAKDVFVSAAIAYVSVGGAVHVLSIGLYELQNTCTSVHTYYYIICFQQNQCLLQLCGTGDDDKERAVSWLCQEKTLWEDKNYLVVHQLQCQAYASAW